MIGSHLDTQPTGGKFDGTLGVLAGLEAVRTLNDLGVRTKHPIQVVNWTNEEGCRFAPSMLASGVYAGEYDIEWAYNRTDSDGLKFGDELERIGWVGDHVLNEKKPKAYFELHIEQGPLLEQSENIIGVVTHGQGVAWTRIELVGKESHTGSTPMDLRQNAGLGMSRIAVLVDDIAFKNFPNAVGTIGNMNIFPNSINIIPGRAVGTVDFRSPDLEILESMKEDLEIGARLIAKEQGLDLSFERLSHMDPVTFDEHYTNIVRKISEELKYPYLNMVSGAGHDAFWVNKIAPSAMIMCPCVDGLSHNEAEHVTPQWAEAGTNVLCRAAVEVAEIIN